MRAAAWFRALIFNGPQLIGVRTCPVGAFIYPTTGDGLRQFDPPGALSARKAVTLGDALGGCLSDPKKIVVKLHVNWGHA